MKPTDVIVSALNADAALEQLLALPVSDTYYGNTDGSQVNVVRASHMPLLTGQGIDVDTGEITVALWVTAGQVDGLPDLGTAWDVAAQVVRTIATTDQTAHAGWHIISPEVLSMAEQQGVPGGLARVVVQLTARVRRAA